MHTIFLIKENHDVINQVNVDNKLKPLFFMQRVIVTFQSTKKRIGLSIQERLIKEMRKPFPNQVYSKYPALELSEHFLFMFLEVM